MKLESVERIFKSLNDENVRYLIAGGLAVVAYGYLRLTADIDLILDMEKKNLQKAMKVFKTLGYRSRAPVRLEDFTDPEKRKLWVQEKGLTVFSLWNPDHPATEIDLFVETPIPFEKAYKLRTCFQVAEGVEATVIGLDDLILLKEQAGRKTDLDDIEKLNALREAGDGG
ncbi:DUF6036 family nucleotidyltransferase [Thermodesulfobacteriota bacterium]